MVSRRLAALGTLFVASSILACSALSGCAAQTDEEDESAGATGGDGTSADQLVGEHQLVGNELPDHTLALTFDDGPGPRTKELAEYLRDEGVHATFFINGMNVSGRQGVLEAVVAAGHMIGNHTQNHLQLTKLASSKVITEVTQTDEDIAAVQPTGPWLLRAPFGAWTSTTARAVNSTAMTKYVGSVFWDVGGELTSTAAADWDCWGKHVTIQKCGDLYMNEMKTRKRGIVLMHDIHNQTTDMVKAILPKLKADGWKFATLDDVPSIKRAFDAVPPGPDDCSSSTLGTSVPVNTCVQSRSNQKWSVCQDAEWVVVPSSDDAKCTGKKYPLP
jgi:peptidoglycan/xylan/chitin deacetylase (PgdA/CDA1 family)